MQSMIRFLAKDNSPLTAEWLTDPDRAFSGSCPVSKAVFLLDQAVMLNYLDRVYGGQMIPCLNQYRDKILLWWIPSLVSAGDNLEAGVEQTLVETALRNIRGLLGASGAISFNADEIGNILWLKEFNDAQMTVPRGADALFYTPYLRFLERAPRSVGYIESEEIDKALDPSFTVDTAALPSFFFSGRILKICYDAVFSSYSFKVADHRKFTDQHFSRGMDSIFSYWMGYNWSGMTFTGMVGLLAMYALELDANVTQNSPAADAFRMLYSKLCSWCAHADTKSALSSDTLFIRRCLVYFMVSVRERYNVTFDDRELVSMIISDGIVEKADSIQQFLEADKASEISVEMYNSFRSSIFGSFTELDTFKQLTNGLGTTMNVTTPKKKADSNDGTTQEPDDTDPDKKDGDTQDEPPKDDNGDEPPAVPTETEPSSAPTIADDGTEDSGNLESGDPANPDSPSEGDPASEPQPVTEVSATHTQIALPKTGHAKGVKFELSQGESFDTALFRFEVEHFINAVLAKPPKSLSPSHAKLLAKIKENWLYLLSPQSLISLLQQVVRVPNRLTFN